MPKPIVLTTPFLTAIYKGVTLTFHDKLDYTQFVQLICGVFFSINSVDYVFCAEFVQIVPDVVHFGLFDLTNNQHSTLAKSVTVAEWCTSQKMLLFSRELNSTIDSLLENTERKTLN